MSDASREEVEVGLTGGCEKEKDELGDVIREGVAIGSVGAVGTDEV